MTVARKAEVQLELGGGTYGSPTPYGAAAPFLQGELKLPSVDITFHGAFCTKHPDAQVVHGDAGCPSCHQETENVIRVMLDYPRDDVSIDCENITHTHECKCHLGHLCESGCPTRDKLLARQEKDPDGKPVEPHALFQMAAEASSDVMRGVYDRLHQLEQDNTALKNLVTKILGVLPEGERNAAMTATIREKLGLEPEHEAVGSAQSIEDA